MRRGWTRLYILDQTQRLVRGDNFLAVEGDHLGFGGSQLMGWRYRRMDGSDNDGGRSWKNKASVSVDNCVQSKINRDDGGELI